MHWLALLAAGIGGAALLALPVLGLPALVLASLVVPLEIGTGTDVKLNLAALLIPVLALVWLLDMARQARGAHRASRANLPLLLFLAASLLSLLIGRATWDPMVPVGDNFLLVQLAQWAIFAFSALAFWLAGNLIKDTRWLWRLTAVFLLVGGGLAILRVLPGVGGLASRFTTIAFIRAPFWVLLTAVAAGQLFFNRALSAPWRVFLLLVLGASLFYAFVAQQEAASNWVGLAAVLGTLIWLRFPRLRWAIVVVLVVLLALGMLVPSVYQFAGGDAEWDLSGGSRLRLEPTGDRGDHAQPGHRAGPGRVPALRQHETVALWPRLLGDAPDQLAQQLRGSVCARRDLGAAAVLLVCLGDRPAGAGAAQTLHPRFRRRLRQRHAGGRRRRTGDHGVRRLDPALRLQHRLPRLPGQRAGVAVPGRAGGVGEYGTRGDGDTETRG